MKTAIEFAWNENLKLDKENRFKSKEEIIDNECVCNCCFNIKLEHPKYCTDGDDELCTMCWNRPIEEVGDKEQESKITEDVNNKLNFNKLYKSPIEGITLNWNKKEAFNKAVLKDENSLIYIDDENFDKNDNLLKYDNLLEFSAWMISVHNYCTELKNKVEYVDFMTAKEWMKQGNKAKFQEVEYFIDDDNLYWELKSKPELTYITLPMLDLNKWILL